jgi:hypothetical protein
MPADGDGILANLPPTFAGLPRPSALASFADAFGGELRDAENSLAAVMFAHWVDFADLNADTLADLQSIAALYGLAPRDDESVEGFRAHLKRYVRTFIDGTTTVRGIFRITAEALGLVIADDQLDTWWDRASGPLLRTTEAAADDAATLLFGTASAMVRGTAAQPAGFLGAADLSRPLDLRGRSLLSVAVNGAAAVTTDLAASLDPAAADLGALVAAIGGIAGIAAEARGGRLFIHTRSSGQTSTLTLGDITGDAVPALLGIPPHDYAGRDATRARIVGTIDLPSTFDLSVRRFLRLSVDGITHEVDCAGGTAAATSLADVVAAINTQAGAGIADTDGTRLALMSATPGLGGSVAILAATAGDVRGMLLGMAPSFARGANSAPARVTGAVDLSAGIDLSQRSKLALAVDGLAAQVIDCAGPTPQKTFAGDIATAINAAIGQPNAIQPVATQNGSAVTLTSLQAGAAGRIRLLAAAQGDALDLIFGIASRTATGTDATAARLAGTPDLSAGVDLSAVQRVQLAIDDATPVIIDLAAAGLGHAGVAAADIAAAVNAATGAATAEGGRLALASTAPGEQGSVALLPIEVTRTRAFVSRAFPIDEASNIVLGSFAADVQGAEATAGRLTGALDLHDGLDLSRARYLRVALDGGAPRDIDCASTSRRARAVLLGDLVAAIDQRLGAGTASVATDSLGTGPLVLTSPTRGAASAVAVPPGGGDAGGTLLGGAPRGVSGTAASRVSFAGLRDLSLRIDLSAANRVRLAIDGGAPVEIVCAGDNPAATSPAEIAGRINGGLGGAYASTDGRVLRLASAVAGSTGGIAFLPPSQDDATKLIFGIAPGRFYHGDDPAPAVLAGTAALPATLDLSATPYLRLAVDDAAGVLIDCRGTDPGATTPARIAQRINDAFAALTAKLAATFDAGRLVLTAASTGPQSRIALQAAADFDAAAVLLGATTAQPGQDGTPATLTGTIDLRQPVDLSQRPVLRLAIDGGRPLDIDVSGAAPDATFGDEIAAALNAALPGLATLDANGHLVLAAPNSGSGSGSRSGADSRLAVLPLRPLELIDYPPVPVSAPVQTLASGGGFTLHNDGAADSRVAFTLSSPGGLCGVELLNLTFGARIRIDTIAAPGEALEVAAADDGSVAATLLRADGSRVALPPGPLHAQPAVLAAVVPFAGARPLAANAPGTRPALALLDKLAANDVVLEAMALPPPAVLVVEADPAAAAGPPPNALAGRLELLGRLRVQGGGADLLDGGGAVLARLRAGAGVAFAAFDGAVVAAQGNWYPASNPAGAGALLVVDLLARLFDVAIGGTALAAVTIDARAGGAQIGARSLAARLAGADGLAGAEGLAVIARNSVRADAFMLPRGRSDWRLLACDGARFDAAHFNVDRFIGSACDTVGVFDVSRFDTAITGATFTDEHAHFAPFGGAAGVTVAAAWQSHRPGAFTVNLPADLPAVFGARFDAARFTSPADVSETYAGVVLDPPDDPDYLPTILPQSGGPSPLVFAEAAAKVPLGWVAQALPFTPPRQRFLSGGRADRPAAIYLREPGVAGFIAIKATRPGAWGDEIAVSLRYAGPALFDLTVAFAGARFECGRQIVCAGRVLAEGESALPPLIADILKPAPVGVVRAKAAGICARVTRERT